MVEAHLRKEKTSQSIQDSDSQWCILHHLLGCCFLAQAQYASHGMMKEKKVNEAVCCFFRYSVFSKTSGKGHGNGLELDLFRIQKFETLLSFTLFLSMYYYVTNTLVQRSFPFKEFYYLKEKKKVSKASFIHDFWRSYTPSISDIRVMWKRK